MLMMNRSNLDILIKPVSGKCNMRCSYCFYADEMKKRENADRGIMDTETAACIIKKAFSYGAQSLSIAFQGGEPALAGLDFYRFFVEKVREYSNAGSKVSFAFQTNGLLIDDEWAEFFRENGFLVGLSVDGSADIHNINRKDAAGKGTHSSVMKAAAVLKKHEVPFNVLTVVNAKVARSPQTVYSFFMKNGLLYQQYIPCLDPIFEKRGGKDYSLTSELYGDFLIRLFKLWYNDRKEGKFVYISNFEDAAGILLGEKPAGCGRLGVCSNQNVVEADGSVYPCDFYALDDYCLGNIREAEFEDFDEKRKAFISQSRSGLDKCKECSVGFVCRGGCRRNRETPGGIGENYFCGAYKKFYEYALPRLEELVEGYR